MPPFHVNLLAVFVSALVAFFLGALWYSPVLFAKAWVKAHGLSDEQVAAMQKGAPKAYGISLVLFIVMTTVLAWLIGALGIATVGNGALLGAIVWLGFGATIGLMGALYRNRGFDIWLIDAGYQLVYLVVMGMILTAWR